MVNTLPKRIVKGIIARQVGPTPHHEEECMNQVCCGTKKQCVSAPADTRAAMDQGISQSDDANKTTDSLNHIFASCMR